jgi:hypothetical protein
MAPYKSLAPTSDKQIPFDNFHRTMKAYCIAAATAGVGMLALTQSADAKVIIVNRSIPIGGNLNLDLNNDGIADVNFSLFSTQAHYFRAASLDALPVNKGDAFVAARGGQYASALMRGARIGPADHFTGTVNSNSLRGVAIEGAECSYSNCKSGGWGNVANRFLGVRFTISGAIHYGWVRITITTSSTKLIQATITQYGYETIPRKAVTAGVASANVTAAKSEMTATHSVAPSLGMLASGVDGLAIWRRKDDATPLLN